MGLISFFKSAGQKLGILSEDAPEETADPAETARALSAAMVSAVSSHGLEIADLAVTLSGDVATVTGTASSQADSEKAVLIVGNHDGIAGVDNKLVVEVPEPPAVYHTVVKGDSLSAIARDYYGVMRLFDVVFEANKPMLKHPDEIYPGQVLRIPPVAAPVHTVAKGETLGGIAKHWYGKPALYTTIFEANRDQLDNPNVVEVGQSLTIPLIDPKVQAPA